MVQNAKLFWGRDSAGGALTFARLRPDALAAR